MQTNFFFGVPLRARATAQDWQRVVSLFQMCLRSALNQKDSDFKILVACHDAPDVAETADPRVQMLQCAAPVPTDFNQQMVDKGRKNRMVRAAVGQMGGGYLMMLDADDFVSNRLVGFVRQDANPNGYIINNGYEFNFSTNRVGYAPRFNQVCGSSGIFHFTPDDLPKNSDDETSLSDKFKSHTHWEQVSAELRRPLRMLPFRGAMYTTNNGENHSVLSGNVGWRRRLIRKLTPTWRASDKLRAEFALS